jgi:iron complex outermembrane receptor protein
LPSSDPFERKVDNNTSWRSNNDLGGASLNVDAKIAKGTLTSTTAWRYWKWNPSNDRDFTGLSVLTLSQAPSVHNQWSQEVRYSGNVFSNLSGVVGLYALSQELKSDPVQTEEAGSAQWRFSQNSTSSLWKTPGLFDGFGSRTIFNLTSLSAAAFAQLDWKLTEHLHLLGGLRYNYDIKSATYSREAYGGLQTKDSALNALKRSIYTSQSFDAKVDNTNLTWLATFNYRLHHKINAYFTYSTAYKPIGLNIGGLPVANGQVLTNLAEVKPEYVNHFELGIKSTPVPGSSFNLTFYNTDIKDYQTLVQTPDPAVNRGYLSNAEKVRVSGAELDGTVRINQYILVRGAFTYTNGKYVYFTNAPVPLEETGSTVSFKDISGGQMPGISKYAGSLGVEISHSGSLIGLDGRYSLGVDGFYRSDFSSSPSPSKYLNIDGYGLLNARITFESNNGIAFSVWSRNVLDQHYFEQLLPASGGSGLYVGVLGDPRTYGITVLYNLQ